MSTGDYDNTNRGGVWKNENKLTEKHPDFKGSLNVGGVDYWLSGWLRPQGANSKSPSMSLSVQSKDEAHNAGIASVKTAQAANPDTTIIEDDIPF
tara:strand:+ start:340 stop:624 length:285 start_codon:yes stop_codon:yes gene_type:complete